MMVQYAIDLDGMSAQQFQAPYDTAAMSQTEEQTSGNTMRIAQRHESFDFNQQPSMQMPDQSNGNLFMMNNNHMNSIDSMMAMGNSINPAVYGAAQPSDMRYTAGIDYRLHPFQAPHAVPPFGPQQQFPGWQPAHHPQHDHRASLDVLGQRALELNPPRPPVLAPPQPHRGSSEDNISPTSSSTSFRNKRVPIQRQRKRGSVPSSVGSPEAGPSGSGNDQAMVVQQSGPMSSSVTVPSRPRPGRKPIPQEDAVDRRRYQNRMAQRNFRDKRQQKLHDSIAELETRRQEYQETSAELNRRLDESHKIIRDLEQRMGQMVAQNNAAMARTEAAEKRCQELESRNQELEKQLQTYKTQHLPSIGQFRPAQSSGPQTVAFPKDTTTPPTSESGMEVDFTNFGRANLSSGYGLQNSITNDGNQMDYTVQAEDHCGFCTDSQNCACAQEKAAAAAEKPAPVSVPGSCDQCRADPVRAQACRDMAASTQISTNSSTSTGVLSSGISSASSMPPPPRTTCSSMVDSFNKYGERTSSIASLFGGQRLNTYPAPSGGGYEFEEKQAAEVLSNLSRRSTMAESPKDVAKSPM